MRNMYSSNVTKMPSATAEEKERNRINQDQHKGVCVDCSKVKYLLGEVSCGDCRKRADWKEKLNE